MEKISVTTRKECIYLQLYVSISYLFETAQGRQEHM